MAADLYHFTECGLDDVYLINGVKRQETAQGTVVKVDDLDGLLEAIKEHLVYRKRPLNGREIRFLRHELDLSQRALAVLLGVDEQTVARWEKGKTRIDGSAERMVRIMCAEQIGPRLNVRAFLEDLAGGDDAGAAAVHMWETDAGWQPVRTAAA